MNATDGSASALHGDGFMATMKRLDESGELAQYYCPMFLFGLAAFMFPTFQFLPSPYGRYKKRTFCDYSV